MLFANDIVLIAKIREGNLGRKNDRSFRTWFKISV